MKELEILFSLFPKSENVLADIRSAKLSPAAPVTAHPHWPLPSFDTAGTGHSDKAIPATSLAGDGLILFKLLLAEATLTQSALKWKDPLK